MLIYNAGINPQIINLFVKKTGIKILNCLVSYGTDEQEAMAIPPQHPWRKNIGKSILDSRTYSLNSGAQNIHRIKRITNSGYISYLKLKGRGIYDHYFSFDEIHDPSGVETNLSHLYKAIDVGLSPIPVVHDIRGEEIDILIDAGFEYIAIGSAQFGSCKVLEKIVRRFEGTGIKLHLFGTSNFRLVANFPIFSCDTSRWAQTAKFGCIDFWNHELPGPDKTQTVYLGDKKLNATDKSHRFNLVDYKYREVLVYYLRDKFNIGLPELEHNVDLQQVVNLYFITELEKAVNEQQRDKGFFTAE